MCTGKHKETYKQLTQMHTCTKFTHTTQHKHTCTQGAHMDTHKHNTTQKCMNATAHYTQSFTTFTCTPWTWALEPCILMSSLSWTLLSNYAFLTSTVHQSSCLPAVPNSIRMKNHLRGMIGDVGRLKDKWDKLRKGGEELCCHVSCEICGCGTRFSHIPCNHTVVWQVRSF